MKKSFMTRVLATGLSLAMAFSLTAATNVSVASAAAKPAMKSTKMTVKVGQSKNYQATAATQKAYKITGIKMSAAGKTKASVTINSSKKSIKVTGLAATKSSNVIITFKNNKTKKTTKVTTKVVVKEVVTKQAIVSAEATGVKTITLTMAKEVASVESPVAITVKKGTADRTFKATAEGKTITLAMDTKLTAGDYSVVIKGLETEELTASVNVAKNETLTSYAISDELIATKVGVSTSAYFYYSALNQYGEKMVADKPNATCTLGKTRFTNNGSAPAGVDADKLASATAEGIIQVFEMPDVFSIVGQKGQITLIDPSGTGVTATKDVTLSAKASASKAEYVGVYHVGSAKILDNIKENDRVRDYELLFKFEDQYGHAIKAGAALDASLTISFAGGITNLSVASGQKIIDRVVDGTEYLAYPLDATSAAYAVAGDALLTITNNERGMLLNTTIKVVKDVVIKNVTFTFDNGVYEGQGNEIGYEIVDTEGNSVTDYATILNAIDSTKLATAGNNLSLKLERNKDGSAKFTLTPSNTFVTGGNSKTDQNSQPGTFTTYWNSTTGGDYFVKTTQCTVYQKRYSKTVQGIDSGVTLSYAIGTGKQEIKSEKILLADQYGNTVKNDTIVAGSDIHVDAITDGAVALSASPVIAIKAVTNDAFEFAVDAVNKKLIITPSAKKAGTGVIYMTLCTGTSNNVDPRDGQGHQRANVSTTEYDAKFTINIFDTKEVANDTFDVTVKDGWTLTEDEAKTFETIKKHIKAYAVIGGNKTQLPSNQYVVVGNKNNGFSKEDDTKGIDTKTGTVTVRVTTYDKVGNPVTKDIEKEYTVSKAAAKIYAVDGTNGDLGKEDEPIVVTKSAGTVITRGSFITQFKYKSQYNVGAVTASAYDTTGAAIITNGSLTWGANDLVYSASLVSGKKGMTYIVNPDSKDLEIDFAKADANEKFCYKITAKATNGVEKSITLWFEVHE